MKDWVWWGTWWAWAEANQGLLSVAALLLALGFALWENRRANQAERRARDASALAAREALRSHIKVLDDLIEELFIYVSGARGRMKLLRVISGSDVAMDVVGDFAEATRLLATTGGLSPQVLLQMLALARTFEEAKSLKYLKPDKAYLDVRLESIERRLNAHRSNFAGFLKAMDERQSPGGRA